MVLLAAGTATAAERRIAFPEEIRGVAPATDGRAVLYVWGRNVAAVDLASGRVRTIAPGAGAGAGCTVDFSPAAGQELLLQEGPGLGRLIWRAAPGWKAREIDTGVEAGSCAGAELFGRKGALLIHRFGQLRFYLPGRRRYSEIYSFYTPSRQAGLDLADIDGNGRPDILCGNYWIRSPEREDLPWRLFAINTWSEEEDSAMLRLAVLTPAPGGSPRVAAAQAERTPARAAVFTAPADPGELWHERRLEAAPPLARVQGLAAGPFGIALGEDNGTASRLLLFRDNASTVLLSGEPLLGVFALDLDRDGRLDLVAAGRRGIWWWTRL